MISRAFKTAMGRSIKLPQDRASVLSTDWDGDRLRCWPSLSSPAEAELMLAKGMCVLFAAAAIAITSVLQVMV